MFAFEKFQPVHQADGGWSFDWFARKPAKIPAPVVETALLSLRHADQLRKLPVLALPPPPAPLTVAAGPTKRAKRRGRYGLHGRLHWVLELDGELVRTKAGKVRRFATKAAALAFA